MLIQPRHSRAKRIVPSLAWAFARRLHHWFERLRIWAAVFREVQPVSVFDKAVLRASLRRGLVQSLKALDRWQDPELTSDMVAHVAGVGRFHLRALTDDLYHVLPSREAKVVSTMRERLTSGSAFVDAGANIGFFTVLASNLVGPSGQVFAIEMMPETTARLRDHVASNQLENVTVLQFALSDRGGDMTTAIVPRGKYGQASIARSIRDSDVERVTVRTATLDELLPSDMPIDLLKMDLESAEYLALKGARQVLERTHAVIIEQLGGEQAAVELLHIHGFRTIEIDGSNVLALRNTV